MRNTTQSKIRSHFEEITGNSLLLTGLAVVLLWSSIRSWVLFVLCLILYHISSGTKHLVLPALILSCFLVPLPETGETLRSGRVIEVRQSYFVLSNRGERLLVYSDEHPILDSIVEVEGNAERIPASYSFYGFPFQRYCRYKGITFQLNATEVSEQKPSHSIRGWMMKRIDSKTDPKEREVLLELLFQIRSEAGFHGFLEDRSISYAGMFLCVDHFLKRRCYPETRKKIRTCLGLIVTIVFHAPFLPFLQVIRAVLNTLGISGRKGKGIAFLIGLRVFPHMIWSPSFLIPYLYSILPRNEEHSHLQRFFLSMNLSSLLFHTVYPLECLCFEWLLPLLGITYLLSIVEVLVPLPLYPILLWIDQAGSFLRKSSLPGSMAGFGMIFYVLLQWSLRSDQHVMRKRIALFFLFQSLGLFHPLSMLCVINVGQGDSIFLKGPFQFGTVLIDTGKPSASQAVTSFLEGTGISHLNTLVITHSDNDHSGNQELITYTYHPDTVLTSHHEPHQVGPYVLYDLNPVESDNENDSSIVTYVRVNGMDVLLCGDISADTESILLKEYPHLNVDLLKVAHHGSKTSSSGSFLDAIHPLYAFISSGPWSIYHHPSNEVIERLNDRRIPYLVTREDGDLMILCFPGFNLLLTASLKIDIIRV
ncbi:MAG: hypothetical protein IJ225_07680 [Solobacterium sp.]|nr:hypothetical protein [Solobacterium sp.]